MGYTLFKSNNRRKVLTNANNGIHYRNSSDVNSNISDDSKSSNLQYFEVIIFSGSFTFDQYSS